MKAIKRKDFFKGLAIGTLSLPIMIRLMGGKSEAQQSAPGLRSEERFQWKMVTTWPPGFPVLGEGCVRFADRVRALSAGRLDIKVFGGGELVPPLEAFDAVRSGAADIGHGTSYYWAGKIPAAQFFASVPFGMNAQQLNGWLLTGGGLELWQELYRQYGLEPMVGGNTGVQMGGWFNREINSFDDLKGLKMRMPGLGGKVLEKAGGTPVLLPGSDLYTGLERGIIDATEWIGPYHDYKMGFYQIARYYYTPGWHETGTNMEFFINLERYQALPKDLQEILQSAAKEIHHWVLCEFETQNAIYLKKLIEEEQVQVRYYPKEMLDQLRIYTNEAMEELADKDAFSRKVYQSYQEYRQQAIQWSNLTEKAFYERIQI